MTRPEIFAYRGFFVFGAGVLGAVHAALLPPGVAFGLAMGLALPVIAVTGAFVVVGLTSVAIAVGFSRDRWLWLSAATAVSYMIFIGHDIFFSETTDWYNRDRSLIAGSLSCAGIVLLVALHRAGLPERRG